MRGVAGNTPSTFITAWPLLPRPNLALATVIPSFVSDLLQLMVCRAAHSDCHCWERREKEREGRRGVRRKERRENEREEGEGRK